MQITSRRKSKEVILDKSRITLYKPNKRYRQTGCCISNTEELLRYITDGAGEKTLQRYSLLGKQSTAKIINTFSITGENIF